MTARATRWLLLMMIMTLIRKLLLLPALILLVLLLKLLEGIVGVDRYTRVHQHWKGFSANFWYL
jgi:hypothetical protein